VKANALSVRTAAPQTAVATSETRVPKLLSVRVPAPQTAVAMSPVEGGAV